MKRFVKEWIAGLLAAAMLGACLLPPGPLLAQEQDQPALSKKEIRRREKAQNLLERGKQAFEAGSYRSAERRLRKALSLDPTLFPAMKYLGLAHLKRGNRAAAFNMFVKYLALNPEDTDIMLTAGVLGQELGQNQRARLYLETGLARQPENTEARMALARLEYEEGGLIPAQEHLQKVLAKEPGRGEAWLLLGNIALKQGDKKAAEKYLKKAAELLPEDTEANYLLATLALDRGDFAAAIPPLERIAGKHEPLAESHYLLAVAYLAQNRNEEALQQFEKTIAIDPEYEQAGYQAGLLWKEAGDTKKAVQRLEAYAESHPAHFDSRLELGRIYLDQNQPEKAQTWLEQALKLEPNHPQVLFMLGKLAYDQGNYTQAYPYLRRALAMDPDNTVIRYLLGATYLELPNFESAERELQWIIKRTDSPEAREMLNQIEKKKQELGKEPATGAAVPPVKTVAVLDFKNSSPEKGYDWIEAALAESAVQDLAMITSLEVVDPAAVDKLRRQEAIAAGTPSRAFKRLGAQAVLTGSYAVSRGQIKISARLVDTETARVIAAASKSGPLSSLVDLERELLLELIPAYVTVSPPEAETMKNQPALDLNSLKDFAQGKKLYYMGKSEQAEKYLQQVANRNPDYAPALADLRAVQDQLENAEVLAILPFKNATGNPDYDWMGLGISESLTTDLKKITGIYLVERSEIDKALEELKLGMLGFLDESTAPQVGKLVGAGVILVGSYQVAGKRLRIDARMVDVETGAILLTEQIQGYEDDIFKLEEQLAVKIADTLNVSLTPEEMAALKQKPNIEKFKSYIVSQASFRMAKEGEEAGEGEEVIRAVAVGRFKNLSASAKYDHLEEAIPGALVTELRGRGNLNMIEREQLDRTLAELQMGKTAYVDEKTAPRLGQLVGADAVLVGFFQIQGNEIRVDVRVVKVDTAEILKTVSVSGSINDIFKVESQLAGEVLAALGIQGAAGGGEGLASEAGEGGKQGKGMPYLAAAYSFLLPGSSQYYLANKKKKGMAMFFADVGLILAAAFLASQADSAFNDYAGSGDVSKYNEGVDQLAARNMLIYGIIGLGAYSAVDAFLEARKLQTQSPFQQPVEETPVSAKAGVGAKD